MALVLSYLVRQNLHVGTRDFYWNKGNYSYILGIRNKKPIINLELTLYFIRKVNLLLKKILWIEGIVLLVSEEKFIKKELDRPLFYNRYLIYYNRKWDNGLFSNFKSFKHRIIINQNYTRLYKLPDLVFFLSLSSNYWILRESKRINLPTIVVGDMDNGLDLADYVLPSNNKSIHSFKFYVSLIDNILQLEDLRRKIII